MATKKKGPEIPSTATWMKASAFATEAEGLGWKVVISETGTDAVEVTACRGDESLVLHWSDGKFVQDAWYQCGSRGVSVRNASAAKKQMAVPVDEAMEHNSKALNNKVAKVRKRDVDDEGERVYRALPFDPDASTDDEVIAAVAGRTLVWRNKVTKLEEMAAVPGLPQRHLRIEKSKKNGKRVLNFASDHGGFRSLYLDAILEVR